MSLLSVAEAHTREQKILAQRTAMQIAGLWAQVDGGSIASSWHNLVPAAMARLVTSMTMAAAGSGLFVDNALREQDIVTGAAGRLVPDGFARAASDGRDLVSLLYQPAIRSLQALDGGATLPRARAAGLMSLDVITRTQVADAGRAAEQVSIAARPSVKGYVRMLSMPSCSRCIILAGRWYRWNAGFRRHPRCDCRAVPAQENTAGDVRTDPKALVASLSTGERERIFGKGGAAALDEGADLHRVVNAQRGTYLAGGKQLTREAAGRRGRLTPDQIFIESQGNRDEAIRLLKLHGYLGL